MEWCNSALSLVFPPSLTRSGQEWWPIRTITPGPAPPRTANPIAPTSPWRCNRGGRSGTRPCGASTYGPPMPTRTRKPFVAAPTQAAPSARPISSQIWKGFCAGPGAAKRRPSAKTGDRRKATGLRLQPTLNARGLRPVPGFPQSADFPRFAPKLTDPHLQVTESCGPLPHRMRSNAGDRQSQNCLPRISRNRYP